METYEKSNSITEVRLSRFSKKEYKNLLSTSEDIKERQKAAQKLVDYLCDRFDIRPAKVHVVNRCQPHSIGDSGRLKMKKLGTYALFTEVITLYNVTAVKKQVVSIKVLAGTLLHEFMHHYDITCLGLSNSPHTAGFYRRISDLERKLKE